MSKQDLVWLEPQSPKEIIEELIDDYKIEKLDPLYSGGQDSGSVGKFCINEYPELIDKFVFTCTGISSPMTREFAVNYIENELEFKLDFTWARKSYYDIVVKERNGFPTAGSHRILMGYLKFQSWYYYLKPKLKRGEKIALVSGVRKKESMTRNLKSFYTKKPIDVNATLTFVKPFLYKNGSQLQEYFIKNGVKKSPAYDYFGKSGECWCGCFYNEWELKMIEKNDSFLFNTIKWLESEVQREIKQIKHELRQLVKKHYRPKISMFSHITKNELQEKIDLLKKQLYTMENNSHWGGSVGTETSILQKTFSDFEVNEDYCGESCIV